MKYRRGKVFVQNMFAGVISESDYGYSFEYDPDYLRNRFAKAVSLTLPLSDKPYDSRFLFPFFDGLIPEGWLLNVVEKNWKIDPHDRFGLMLASCRDCIGDVSIIPEND